MNVGVIIQLLNKEYGCNIASDYYVHIDEWVSWWRGFHEPFHRYREMFGGRTNVRELYSLKMAKKICEDWAAILLNEKTEIVVDDKQSDIFLQGENGNGGVLAENKFWQRGNELVENAFCSGTGAFVLKLQNVRVNKNSGRVIKDNTAKISIDYVHGKHIIPLSVKKGDITEAAFVSEVTEKGSKFIYLETHTRDEQGNYVIKNRYYKNNDGNLVERPLPQGMAAEINTGSDIAWFSLVYPNIVNNIENNNNLGISVFANAIDTLKGVDLAFNNFCRDFKLGGKKVFYNRDMLQFDDNGNTITPDDTAQQLFYLVGDDVSKEAKMVEHNPDLRIADNRDGVQAHLDYLSFKCGLGSSHYQFQSGKVMTATEYTGTKQDLVQNANKHYIVVKEALQSIVKAILYAGKEFCGEAVNPDSPVEIKFEDSYIINKEAERERDRQDVRDGTMMKWEYRVKWFGETEEEAKRILSENMEEDDLMFGGE